MNSGDADGEPSPARDQCEWQHQPELRFVDQQTEQDSSHDRPAVQQQQSAAHQGRRQRTILPADRVDEQRRRRERKQQHAVAAGELERPVKRVPRSDQPDAQRRDVRNERQRQRQQQQHRRIGIVIKIQLRPGERAFEDVEGREIIYFDRTAMQREKRTGPVVDEIVAKRAPDAVGQAVLGLAQQIDDVGDERNDNPDARDQPNPRWIRQNTRGRLRRRYAGYR